MTCGERSLMNRIFPISSAIIAFFLFFVPVMGSASYYWDYPRSIGSNKGGRMLSDVKIISVEDHFLLFFLEQTAGTANIKFVKSNDLHAFSSPYIARGDIKLKEGFSPHFDVYFTGSLLLLVWNTMDGLLHYSISSDGGNSWETEKVLVRNENFCFRPMIFMENDTIYLFYHIESEGRRIDFFFISSQDMGKGWTAPYQIAKGFAGSFFPSLHQYKGTLYVFWQSRPLSETETPVFNIYFSTSTDKGRTWSVPRSIMESSFGENAHPVVYFSDDRFHVIFEGDRGGVTGIYYREYTPSGAPLTDERKVNNSLATAISPEILGPRGQLLIFYLDRRDGDQRLYYALLENGDFIEEGPFGRNIIRFLPFCPSAGPFKEGATPFVFWQDRDGIKYLGPDERVDRITLLPLMYPSVGKNGLKISWKEGKDSSGIEGYCYSFTREREDVPEILNLSPFANSVTVTAAEEGTHYFHIRAKDRAGNYSETVTIPLTVDVTPPPVPTIQQVATDTEGFAVSNSPIFQWSVKGQDVAGYNYSLSKKQVTITRSRIRTTRRKAKYSLVEEGNWYFNVAAIDRAGNVGQTAHLRLRMRPLPEQPSRVSDEQKRTVKLAPPWMLRRETFEVSPVLNISLYLVLGGLLFVTTLLFTDVISRLMIRREGVPMTEKESMAQIRKKRFGLRFKFSLLIVSLILILTIGISSILSIVSTENQRKALADQMMDKARLSLENMTNVAREGILNNDELLLLAVIAKTMENRDISYSSILDTGNRVIAHSDINKRGEVFEDELSRRALESDEILIEPDYDPEELAPLYILASPVKFAETRLGTVQIGYSTDSIFKTIDEARRENLYSALIVTGITILVGILGAVLMASITIKPIKVLARGANIIGEGRLDYKIHIKARDEIGLLSDEFNRMTDRLLEYQRKMEEKAKLDEQLEIARKIQQDLIPHSGIENTSVSIDGYYKAAAGVGGDYYDFIQIGSDRYGLIMSDVAGKGVPASLMMIMIRTVFKSLINSGVIEPSRLVTLMNDTLASDIQSDRFATLLFGVFSCKNRQFRYTNAGYGPLLVYKKTKNNCFLVNPPQGSVPIGVMPEVKYEEEKPILLDAGDSLYLFTDGIHEARNGNEEEYGMKRLAGIIPSFAERESREIAGAIVDDVSRFVGNAEQYDDMTLTVMKVK